MSEKQKEIMETLNKVMPKMTDTEREKLLSFAEGMAFMADRRPAERPGPNLAAGYIG